MNNKIRIELCLTLFPACVERFIKRNVNLTFEVISRKKRKYVRMGEPIQVARNVSFIDFENVNGTEFKYPAT